MKRITDPAPADDLAAAVASNADVGLDLYRAVAADHGGNVVISPESIAFSLAMAYAGAAGQTQSAFETALRIGIPEARYHRAMNDLDRELAAQLQLVNQIFAQDGFPFETPFLDTLAGEYGAGVRLLDFAGDAEASRKAINTWVDAATNGYIPELLPAGTIDSNTRFSLVNAVYFKAAWASEFTASTSPSPFTRLDGSSVDVATITAELSTGTAQVDGVDLVEVPYADCDMSLLIMVPPAAAFSQFEQALTDSRLQAYVAALQQDFFSFTLPKWEVRTPAKLKDPLAALGLSDAFDPANADFSGMSSQRLWLSDVIHQAFIHVDENGTVAAAATASNGAGAAAPGRQVTVNSPFVYAIRHRPTGAVVFVGRVLDPSQG